MSTISVSAAGRSVTLDARKVAIFEVISIVAIFVAGVVVGALVF